MDSNARPQLSSLSGTLAAAALALWVGCIDTTIPDLTGALGSGPTAGRFCSPEEIENFEPQTLRLDIIDVGQGDAIFVRTPYDDIEELESLHILIDTGSAGTVDGTSPGGDVVVNYLLSHGHEAGRPLDALIITHGHEDHYGGMPTVVDNFDVLRYVDPGYVPGTNGFGSVRNTTTSKVGAINGRLETPAADSLGAVPVDIDVFGTTVDARMLWASKTPPSGATSNPSGTDINNTSIVLSLTYGGRRVLLMGDAEEEIEAMLVEKANTGEIALVADVLKVGHHGSDSSSSQAFLDAVFKDGFVNQYSYAVISSGVRSFSGTQLPASETVERLNDKLEPYHVLSTENGDRDDPSVSTGDEHDDDHIVITIRQDGQVDACYGN